MEIIYNPEPTANRMHMSRAFVRGLMGPIGSGKSVSCVEDLKNIAIAQQQPDARGIRRTRFAVIRNTYPELKSTTIKTWRDWFPVAVCPMKYDSPISCRMRVKLPDGTVADMECYFLALDKPKDIKKLLSLELTAGWINEAREVPKPVLDALTGRVGRYPPRRDGGPTRACVIMDTNPPDDDHWWYRLAEEERPQNWEFFTQPPALLYEDGDWVPNPEAENIRNLPNGYQYYLNQVGGKTKQWIRVYIEGKYGTIMDGRAVYPEYNDDTHCAEEPIEPHPDCQLILGWDFGLTPACVIGQLTPRGRLVLLTELIAERMGLRQFVEVVVRPFLSTRLAGFSIGASGADPAGEAGAETDMQSCISVLNEMDIPTVAAPTNKIEPRLQAVRDFLTRMVDGKPGFLISRSCRRIRKGFNGGYKYERVQTAGDERYKDRPCKNMYSHPHDALQYLCLLAAKGYETNVERQRQLAVNGAWSYGQGSTGESGYIPVSSAGY